jgi:TnpA family transposase
VVLRLQARHHLAQGINDRFAGLGATIVTGTVRDSLHILDTLLNLDAGPRPDMVTTDTASYPTSCSACSGCWAYRFSPRIADIGRTGFWRADLPGQPPADYGPLNAIARNRSTSGGSSRTGRTCCASPALS